MTTTEFRKYLGKSLSVKTVLYVLKFQRFGIQWIGYSKTSSSGLNDVEIIHASGSKHPMPKRNSSTVRITRRVV